MSHPSKYILNPQNTGLSDLPIGVFDSGIGGLTVLKALTRHFPKESYIYIGDTARLPYGTKSPETVIRYAQSLTSAILKKQVKAIVVACNTASTHALSAVQEMAGHLPVIGMIDPAAEAALAATKSGHIGVIATMGTVKSAAYERALKAGQPECRVSSVACQMLVALAEEGWAEGDIPRAVLHRYLDPVFNRADSPDTLILGCTHFPVFAGLLTDVLGPSVKLINSGEAAALHLTRYIGPHPQKDEKGADFQPVMEFLVTDGPARFAENAVRFFDKGLSPDSVRLIDIV